MRIALLVACGVIVVLFIGACQSSNSGGAPGQVSGDASSCTASSDCFAWATAAPSSAVACCIRNACVYGIAAEAETCADAASQNIMASSYDQTCQVDSDCVAVEEGNFCTPGANNGCTNATINKSALPQYRADLAKTQAGICSAVAGCTVEIPPCCQSGTCSSGCTTGHSGGNDAGTDVASSAALEGD